jgi:hypothetical protein
MLEPTRLVGALIVDPELRTPAVTGELPGLIGGILRKLAV